MKRINFVAVSAITIALLMTGNVEAGVIRPQGQGGQDYVPTGKGWGVPDFGNNPGQKGGKGGGGGGGGGGGHTSTSNGIDYHGGPVMLGTTNIYYIWYGDWSYNTAAAPILDNLALSLGGSPYFNINTTYYDGSNNKVSNAVAAPSSTVDNYSRGTALGDSDIQGIVADAISSGSLPKDANGVYVVLTSKDVNETSGFCTMYCGWHTHAKILGTDTKFAFVGDAARCPSACSAQTGASPNNNVGADAMASVIAHETDEMVTDPDLNAWYDHRGYENADKCAWKYGTTYKVANGSYANMNLGGRDYLIQQNWENANGGNCVLSYP
jgi:hypothetical protein